MKRLLIAGILACTACATVDKNTGIQPVKCITAEQYKKLVDAEPAKIGNVTTGDLNLDYKTSVKQNVLVRQYADGLLVVLGGCIGQDK